MAAYCFFDVREVRDPAKMEAYRARVFDVVAAHGGTYLIVGGDVAPIEGKWKPNFPVLIRFPDVGSARAWYDSTDYKELKAMRIAATVGDGVIMESQLDDFVTEA